MILPSLAIAFLLNLNAGLVMLLTMTRNPEAIARLFDKRNGKVRQVSVVSILAAALALPTVLAAMLIHMALSASRR